MKKEKNAVKEYFRFNANFTNLKFQKLRTVDIVDIHINHLHSDIRIHFLYSFLYISYETDKENLFIHQ